MVLEAKETHRRRIDLGDRLTVGATSFLCGLSRTELETLLEFSMETPSNLISAAREIGESTYLSLTARGNY